MLYNYAMEKIQLTKEKLDKMSIDDYRQMVPVLLKNIEELNKMVSQLTETIAVMNQRQYGRKTEQASGSALQMSLFDNLNEPEYILDTVPEEPEPEIETVVVRKKRQKGKLETDLKKVTEHEEVELTLSDEELAQMYPGRKFKIISYEYSHKLEHIPACFKVITYKRAVYGADDNQTIVRAPKPAELWSGSIATPSLVASMINGKYANAVPLYRQEQEFKANDVDINRGTMARWIIKAYDRYLKYLYEAMKDKLMEQKILHADETPFEVNKDGRSAGSKSYMWVYRGGVEGDSEKIIIYDYCHTRGSQNADRFLSDYSGCLITDGYQAYHKLQKDNPDRFKVAGCWTHAKRKFSDVAKTGKNKGEKTVAAKAENMIRKIYNEDNKLKNLSTEERRKQRQIKVKPLVDKFFTWVKEVQPIVSPTSETGKALKYALNQEQYLRVFLEDGRLPLDNNAAERAIRPFTVGRKNWVMVDTKSGAEASAAIYSIIETAKANNLKTYAYLNYVLTEPCKTVQDFNTEIPEHVLPWSDKLPAELRRAGS